MYGWNENGSQAGKKNADLSAGVITNPLADSRKQIAQFSPAALQSRHQAVKRETVFDVSVVVILDGIDER
jgi:hypothetical protein